MMSTASALVNYWVVCGSSCRRSADGFKTLARNHNVTSKGNQFLHREKVASPGCQITRVVPKDSNKGTGDMETQWWDEEYVERNLRSIKSQDDLDEQLLTAGDKLTVVHFFSPRCGACKALHPKVHQFAEMHPELQFLVVNCDEQGEVCNRLNVHVLPLFQFYRGAEGRISSFSRTTATIRKFREALRRFGVKDESLDAEKGSAEEAALSSQDLAALAISELQQMLHTTRQGRVH